MKSLEEVLGHRPHMIEQSLIAAGFLAFNESLADAIGAKRQPLCDGVQVPVAEGIAIVDISGVLINDGEWWDGWGYSTYDRIAQQVNSASQDSSIEGILLRVNSPGGETDNAFETADAIVAAGTMKPIWASVDTSAYSAGYLLASSAEKIFVSPKTGGVGSIGVYSLHMDYSEALKQYGIKATFIEAGKGKTEGHPYKPLSSDGKAKIAEEIQRLYGMFVGHVAKRRKMTAERIVEMGAALKNGAPDAIESRLADASGTLSAAHSRFRGYLDARKEPTSFTVAAASAATSTREESAAMFDPTKPADAKPSASVTQPEAPAPAAPAAAAQVPATSSDAEEINQLCLIGGLNLSQATAFIKQGKTAAQVREAILEMRVSGGSKSEIISQIQPQTGSDASVKNKVSESPLMKAIQCLGKEGF